MERADGVGRWRGQMERADGEGRWRGLMERFICLKKQHFLKNLNHFFPGP